VQRSERVSVAEPQPIAVWGRFRAIEVRLGTGRLRAKLEQDRIVVTATDPASDQQLHQAIADLLAAQVRQEGAALVAYWQSEMGLVAEGLAVTHLSVRHMRTRWGSCTPSTRRIRLAAALALFDPRCLEYVVVHELSHLRFANHGKGFVAHMDRWLPTWRQQRAELREAVVRPI
jgi:predicted metal-dependent hydrolase